MCLPVVLDSLRITPLQQFHCQHGSIFYNRNPVPARPSRGPGAEETPPDVPSSGIEHADGEACGGRH